MASARNDAAAQKKRVYYLSLEFLPGRLLLDSLNNAGLTEPMRLALGELGVELSGYRGRERNAHLVRTVGVAWRLRQKHRHHGAEHISDCRVVPRQCGHEPGRRKARLDDQ